MTKNSFVGGNLENLHPKNFQNSKFYGKTKKHDI